MAKAKTEQIALPLAVSEAQVEGLITSLPIDKIAVSPRALRDDEVVADIAASISIDGLLTPITVRMVPGKEEPVRRLRFNDKGEVLDESTFATEAELQGFKEEQLPLGLGPGERPIDDLPLFDK